MRDSLLSIVRGRLTRKLPNDFLTARLEKAAAGDICPICTLDGRARHIWLWSFMWENVNDPDTREKFIKAGGLCRADNWSMVEVSRDVIKSMLGVAIVFEHLVKVATRALMQGKSPEPWINTHRWTFDVGQNCQACSIGGDAVRRSGDRLNLASVIKRRPEWLAMAFPLCHAHFRRLVGEASRPRVRGALAALQQSGIEGLAAAVSAPRLAVAEGRRRLEASLLPGGSVFPVPRRSESLYQGAIERCPVCESVGTQEKELVEDDLVTGGHGPEQVLCLGHYRAFADRHPRLSVSMLSARLKEEGGRLERMVASPAVGLDEGPAGGGPDSWGCALCRRTREAEEEKLGELASGWREGRSPDDLLCLRHLGRALSLMAEKDRPKLITDQLTRLGDMLKELRGFIELHDYRSQQRPAENPNASYRWALRFLTSEPALVASMLSTGGSERFLPGRSSVRRRR